MSLLQALEATFTARQNPSAALQMERYMKQVAPFFGLSAPVRRALMKDFWKQHERPSIHELPAFVHSLMEQPQREYHYTAIELCYDLRKQWLGRERELFEWMIQIKPWWDTVDAIAIHLLGEYFLRFPDQKAVVQEYTRSSSMWLRRTAIIFQNAYRQKTDEPLLIAAIIPCLAEPDFFIRKAIGWALREYAKTNPAAVRHFVAHHDLSPLSRREALKHLC